MDLQGTNETRAQEEGADGPLGGASGRSNERRDSHGHDTPSNVRPHRRGPAPFEYPPGSGQTIVITERVPTPSSRAIPIPKALNLSARDLRLARKARHNPPVTKKTLSELDLACIMSNINLRMDANFDRDLHFKPDLGGEKGQRKLKEGGEYWEAIATEIAIYQYCAQNPDAPKDSSEGPLQTLEPRFPDMFKALEEIIKTLVPVRDHAAVSEHLDVSLLMQQIRRGVLDMVGTSQWMASLLQTHCAPLRDQIADDVVTLVAAGQKDGDAKKVAEGLQKLFGLLETMKLDVANHQIRSFRILLIQDTVPFLKDYFQEKMETGDLQIGDAGEQYDAAAAARRRRDRGRQWPPVLGGLSFLICQVGELLAQPEAPEDFPATFVFDTERLWALRGAVQNLLNMQMAWHVLMSCLQKRHGDINAARANFKTFWSRIWSLVTTNDDPDACPSNMLYEEESDLRAGVNWLRNIESVSLEVARFASLILRHREVRDEVLFSVRADLIDHLSGKARDAHRLRHELRENIIRAGLEVSQRFIHMTPLEMADDERRWLQGDGLDAQRIANCLGDVPQPDTIKQEISRISVRLAHIGVLHWRVWAPLVYLPDGA